MAFLPIDPVFTWFLWKHYQIMHSGIYGRNFLGTENAGSDDKSVVLEITYLLFAENRCGQHGGVLYPLQSRRT
jgi:hypothetical protein